MPSRVLFFGRGPLAAFVVPEREGFFAGFAAFERAFAPLGFTFDLVVLLAFFAMVAPDAGVSAREREIKRTRPDAASLRAVRYRSAILLVVASATAFGSMLLALNVAFLFDGGDFGEEA